MTRALLPTQVRAIRRALANGDSIPTIAARHNVHRLTVTNIRDKRWYKDVSAEPTPAARLVAVEAMLRVIRRRVEAGKHVDAVTWRDAWNEMVLLRGELDSAA